MSDKNDQELGRALARAMKEERIEQQNAGQSRALAAKIFLFILVLVAIGGCLLMAGLGPK